MGIASEMRKKEMMKRVITFFIVLVSGFSLSPMALAQQDVRGTEEPAVYQEKDAILAKQRRVHRSQTIQGVARLYREMVSSYKARRVIHAEALSQELDTVLDNPILPDAFAKKMRIKHHNFLTRIYGDQSNVQIDVPVDGVSDEEVAQIQQTMAEKKGEADVVVLPQIHRDGKTVISAATSKEVAAQLRIDEKKRIREERRAEKEKKRQEKIAARQKRCEQRLEQLKAKKAKKNSEPINVAGLNRAERDESQLNQDIALEKRSALQAQKLLEYQDEYLDLKSEEVDRYVRLYKQAMKKREEILKKDFLVKIDSLYQDGIDFFGKKAYRFAHEVFIEVEKLEPGYKLTHRYLKELKRYFQLDLFSKGKKSPVDASERNQLIVESLDAHNP